MWIFIRVHGEGPQTTVGWLELAIFGNFGQRIFGALRVEAIIITQHHEVLYWLSSDTKMLDLE